MGPLGTQELIVIFVLALLIFGPRKLPELGKTVAKAIGEFRRASNELKATYEREVAALEKENESIKEVAREFQNDVSSSHNYDGGYNYDSDYYGSESYDSSSQSSTVGASATEGAESNAAAETASATEGQEAPAAESVSAAADSGPEVPAAATAAETVPRSAGSQPASA